MTDLVVAAACLIAAQAMGIYALVTRKADLIFALVMGVLLLVAVVLGYTGLRQLGA